MPLSDFLADRHDLFCLLSEPLAGGAGIVGKPASQTALVVELSAFLYDGRQRWWRKYVRHAPVPRVYTPEGWIGHVVTGCFYYSAPQRPTQFFCAASLLAQKRRTSRSQSWNPASWLITLIILSGDSMDVREAIVVICQREMGTAR